MSEKQVSLEGFPTKKSELEPNQFEAPIVLLYGTEGVNDRFPEGGEQRKVVIGLQRPWSKKKEGGDDEWDEDTLKLIRLTTHKKNESGEWVKKSQDSNSGKWLKALDEVELHDPASLEAANELADGQEPEKGVSMDQWTDILNKAFLWADETFSYGKGRESKLTIPIAYLGTIEEWNESVEKRRAGKA
jgi:hypothetical protein